MDEPRTYPPRESWHGFYTTAFWQRRRRNQLLEHPLCAFCSDSGRLTRATVVDHVEPHRGDWNRFALGSLQSLCGPCHSSIKQRVELGRISKVDANGWPLDRK